MSRTYRNDPVRTPHASISDKWNPATQRFEPTLGRIGDRHIQRLPKRSARVLGDEAHLDWDDEFGGHTMGKALRLAGKAAIANGIEDWREIRAESAEQEVE